VDDKEDEASQAFWRRQNGSLPRVQITQTMPMALPVSHLSGRYHLCLALTPQPFFDIPRSAINRVKPMNAKLTIFSCDPLAICPFFRPNSVQNCEFRFSVQNAKFYNFVRFLSKTILFSP